MFLEQAADQRERSSATSTIVPILIVCTLWTSGATALEISARSLEQGGFELTLTNSSRLDERTALAYVAQAATSVCGTLTPVLGKYKFESKEVLGTNVREAEGPAFRFVQEVSCVAGTSAARPPPPPPPTLGSPEEERHVRDEILKASEGYFRLLDDGKVEQAYALMAQTSAGPDKATWMAGKQSFHSVAGSLKSVSIVKITVYDNPPDAPAPGLYVAADFQNSYKSTPYECGYLMWFRPVGGAFSITRTESGFVSSEVLERIPEDQRPDLLRKLECAAP